MRRNGARPYGRRMTDTTTTPSSTRTVSSPRARLWSRAFAVIYDPTLWIGEVAGMRRRRRDLLGTATGRTLEIGGGTGLNIAHYPDDLPELIVAEPEAAMRRRLVKRAARAGRRVRVLDAPAERLPLDDASIDTVVCTLVLCTVEDPAAALSEIVRVLRPGGQLLFIEHVRSDSRALAWCQDRLAWGWRRFAEGCRCNRPTARLMAASGLTLEARDAAWRAMPPIVRPLITGRATIARQPAG
jgi:SAM-dependent methyltransferase